MQPFQRRMFLKSTATGLGVSGLLTSLPAVKADDLRAGGSIARFAPDIEPLVRFLEDTPEHRVIEETARKIKTGLSYRELLAALLLAGVRNVQPRPSVGFKFHAVLVVNSAHLASISGLAEERWLPILWAIDNFKRSQARDIQEGNWTLPEVDESALPAAHQAEIMLKDALDAWDEAAADAAITSCVRNFGSNQVFELLAEYAARDFRSIGHKIIYLANAFRTLHTIGWEYAEPVMRSLVYAMLNHNGEPNPAQSNLAADQPGRINRERLEKLGALNMTQRHDPDLTRSFVRTLHDGGHADASQHCADLLLKQKSASAIWDGLFGSAAEILMRQPGIVALHAVTTTNAMRYTFETTSNQATRKFLLLQNAAFLALFREAAAERGQLRNARIDEMAADAVPIGEVGEVVEAAFDKMGSSRRLAAEQLFSALSSGVAPQAVVDHARRLVFLKGNDSHDYKFSSAALEDYRRLSPEWGQRYLAASMYQLCSPHEKTRPLVERIHTALG